MHFGHSLYFSLVFRTRRKYYSAQRNSHTYHLDHRRFYTQFSNSLIIHAALTQPECLILVRWMDLETQWKSSWKHGRVCKPVFETISNTDANFLNLHIDKATKTRGDKQLYLITHFMKQTLNLNYFILLTLNVTEQFLKNPKQKRPFFF